MTTIQKNFAQRIGLTKTGHASVLLCIVFLLMVNFWMPAFAGMTDGEMYEPVQASRDKLSLSLEEAISLAIASNPNVQSAELNHTMQKFNLHIQEWQFQPQYSFMANVGSTRSVTGGLVNEPITSFNVQPAINLTTPIGTKFTLSATNARGKHYNPGVSLQILQPLMRGFGKPIVEAALMNARDSEVVSRLTVEGVLRTTVTNVINAYLGVVKEESALKIDEKALERAQASVKQTTLFIKSGRKAGNELVTVQANEASAQTELENDRNNLQQARYSLLTAIGLDPNTPITFAALDIDDLIKKYHLLSLQDTKALLLKNDIQYQTDVMTLHGATSRQLLTAEDNTRPRLDFSANLGAGNGAGGGFNSGTNSLWNGQNYSQNVGLTLQIPIDDQLAKQSLLSAKIALKQANLALKTLKWSKETAAINAWNLVISAKRALKFAEDAEHLQELTYKVSYQKYLHGLIDSLELQTAQVALIRAQQTLLTARINYLKSLVELDLLIGHTLKTWNIQVRL